MSQRPRPVYVLDWDTIKTDVLRLKDTYMPSRLYVPTRDLVALAEEHASEFHGLFQSPSHGGEINRRTLIHRIRTVLVQMGWKRYSEGNHGGVYVDPRV